MAFVKIKPRRGTNAEWEAANPILENGELGIVVPDTGTGTGTIKMKIGDGVNTYTNLPYALDLSSFVPGGTSGTVTNIGLFVDRNNWILTDGIYKNTINVNGITADCYPQFTLIPANGEYPTNEEVLAFNYIDDLVTGEGTITFRARTLPISSIAVLVKDDAGTGDNVIANYAELVSKLNSAESNISNLQLTSIGLNQAVEGLNTNLNAQIAKTRKGTTTPQTISQTSSVNVTVTFDTPFSDANYKVTMGNVSPSTYIFYGIFNKTANGFSVALQNTSNVSVSNCAYDWIAMHD